MDMSFFCCRCPSKPALTELMLRFHAAVIPYGGGIMGGHVGGFCGFYDRPEPWVQAGVTMGKWGMKFDLDEQAPGASRYLAHPMLLLECLYRCRCVNETLRIRDSPIITRVYKAKRGPCRGIESPGRTIWQLALDIPPIFRREGSVLMQRESEEKTHLPYFSLQLRSQYLGAQMLDPDFTRMNDRRFMRLDAENRIKCRGDLPIFRLQKPTDTYEVKNNQELCATEFDYGHE